MSLSAVLFKYMAKQAVDCRNMVRVKVWYTHTIVWLLKNYSERILTYYTRILLLDLTYGRTMPATTNISTTPLRHIGTTWQIRLSLCFLWATRVHNQNCKSIGSAISAQLTEECHWACPSMSFALKLPLRTGIWKPIQYMVPWAHPSPKPKQHLDWFSHFCTVHCSVSLYF